MFNSIGSFYLITQCFLNWPEWFCSKKNAKCLCTLFQWQRLALEQWLQTGGDSNVWQWPAVSSGKVWSWVARATVNGGVHNQQYWQRTRDTRHFQRGEDLPVQNCVSLRKTSVRDACLPLTWTVLHFAAFPLFPSQTCLAWQQSDMYVHHGNFCGSLSTAVLSRHTGVSACTSCLANTGIVFFKRSWDFWQSHSDVLQIQGEWSPPSRNKWNHPCSSLTSWSFSAFEEEVKGDRWII